MHRASHLDGFLKCVICNVSVFIQFGSSAAYEEEILERIVIPLFSDIHHENEASVRTSVGKLLLDFVSHCDTKRSLELLDVVEKLFNRSFEKSADEGKSILKNEHELAHIATMVDELIRVSTN